MHPWNHLGGVSNKKQKSAWKENFVFNPSPSTWLFERIWYVVSQCLEVIKEARVD